MKIRTWTLAVPMVLAVTAAVAQPHEQRAGAFVLRASTVDAAQLPDGMRQRHGISMADRTGVLNVTVQFVGDSSGTRNVQAELDVAVRNLYGVRTPLDMRELRANGMVSYFGAYSFLPREVLDFRIVARPAGADMPVVLTFRDRLR